MLNAELTFGPALGTDGAILSFVGGRFQKSHSNKCFDSYNPATEESLAKVEIACAGTVDQAVRAAHSAFEIGAWPRMPAAERASYLFAIADLLEANSEALAFLESRDTGLPILFTRGGHIPKAISQFRYFAEEATRTSGKVLLLDDAYMSTVLREPAGVAAIITPWNAPLAVAAGNLSAALACGTCCVLKPSEEASLTTAVLARFCHEVGLPPGVVNIVFGPGEPTGEALVSHPLVNVISFTGGSIVGEHVMIRAASGFKRVGIEAGGKSACIVFDDANFDDALDGIMMSLFANNGEVCAAGSRILAADKCYDRVLEGLVARARAIRVGDPADSTTELGPLISLKHWQYVSRCIADGIADGALLACGGQRPAGFVRGYYMEPTVMANVSNSMRLAQTEVFGPVAAVIRFDGTERSAIQIANDSRFGLAAYVWSSDWPKAFNVARQVRAGFVAVNAPFVRDHRAPFGGYKQSGVGRIGGDYSTALFTETKTTCLPIRAYPFPRLGAIGD